MDSHSKKFIIIVCCSHSWPQIPSGTFGISWFLNKHTVQHQILHTHLRNVNENFSKIMEWIEEGYHFILLLHWKENVQTFYEYSNFLKSKGINGERLACGGMTASFFHDEILRNITLPDLVFRGDVELPLIDFAFNRSLPEIPNISFLEGEKIFINPISWFIEEELYSGLDLCYFEQLIDKELYFAEVNKTHFHINLSRGCNDNCCYCGGSLLAFSKHSNRKHAIYRSTESVVRDIITYISKVAGMFDIINIDFEDFFDNYMPVVEALSVLPEAPKLSLSLSERGFLEVEKLEGYLEIFKKFKKINFQISPETEDDKQRKKLMLGNRKHLYTEESVDTIAAFMTANKIYLQIFYSLFNSIDDKKDILRRLEFLKDFKLSYENATTRVITGSIALDPGSHDYFSIKRPPSLDDYYRFIEKFSNLLGNYTYIPDKKYIDYLILSRFYILIVLDKKNYEALQQNHHLDAASILRAVEKLKLSDRKDDMAYFNSMDFVNDVAGLIIY